MPILSRSLFLSRLSTFAASQKSRCFNTTICLLLSLLIVYSGRMQAQAAAAPPAPTSGRIIVKIKPSLASETETQLANVAAGQPMKIRAGQS